jgi:hypothetical protein
MYDFFNCRLYYYSFVVYIMKLSVTQKELSKTVKFALRTSGSKIEVITARGTSFKPFLLYQRTPNRYEGNIKMYVKRQLGNNVQHVLGKNFKIS